MGFLKNRIKAFSYAFNGLFEAVKKDEAIKVHLLATVVVTAAGLFFKIGGVEWCIVLICCGMVVAAELFNTALERFCNHMNPEIHPNIKYIKDVSAAAVLVLSITAVVVAVLIFYKYFVAFFD